MTESKAHSGQNVIHPLGFITESICLQLLNIEAAAWIIIEHKNEKKALERQKLLDQTFFFFFFFF